MWKKATVIVILLMLLSGIAIADEENKKLTIKHDPERSFFTKDAGSTKVVSEPNNESSNETKLPTISLFDAALRSNFSENKTLDQNESQNQNQNNGIGTEKVEDDDFLSRGVSAGLTLFIRTLINDIFKDVSESSSINETLNTSNGNITAIKSETDHKDVLLNIISYNPNPYKNMAVVDLYGGYLNLIIFFVILFLLGELISRSIARTKLESDSFGYKKLSQYKFVGGIALCGFAIVANIFFMGALYILEAINGYIVLPNTPVIAPAPNSLLLFSLTGLGNLIVIGFFVVRLLIIYIFAVVCGIVAFFLVPRISREAATDCLEKIIRILVLQPAILFVIVVGRIGLQASPEFVWPFGNFAIAILMVATCWYVMFGNFRLLKIAVVYAIRKGVTKI